MLRRTILQLLLTTGAASFVTIPSIASASGAGGGDSSGGGDGAGNGGANGGSGAGSDDGAGHGNDDGNDNGNDSSNDDGGAGSGPASAISGSSAGDRDSQNAAIGEVQGAMEADGMSAVSPADLSGTMAAFR